MQQSGRLTAIPAIASNAEVFPSFNFLTPPDIVASDNTSGSHTKLIPAIKSLEFGRYLATMLRARETRTILYTF